MFHEHGSPYDFQRWTKGKIRKELEDRAFEIGNKRTAARPNIPSVGNNSLATFPCTIVNNTNNTINRIIIKSNK